MPKPFIKYVINGLTLMILSISAGEAFSTDPGLNEYFRGKPILFPLITKEKTFFPEKKQANFTYFAGCENIEVKDNKLSFTLKGNKAVLGWGNFAGKQPIKEIVDLWKYKNDVCLQIKQDANESQWTLYWWRDGTRYKGSGDSKVQYCPAVLKGTSVSELNFESKGITCFQPVRPDGFELEVNAEKGTRFEIDWVKVIHSAYYGYCRKEYTLPEGKVLKAVADVGGPDADLIYTRLFVNGKYIKRNKPVSGRKYYHPTNSHTGSIDITKYLQSGANCIGLEGYQVKLGNLKPFTYFQATIIMKSGEVIRWQTDSSWKYDAKIENGWNEPGFNESSWQPVRTGKTADVNKWLGVRSYKSTQLLNIPSYSGLLEIMNPIKKDLIYRESNDVVVNVRVPKGLEARQPVLSYQFASTDDKGVNKDTNTGEVKVFSQEGNYLIFTINAGKKKHGVYTIALELMDSDGKMIESRPREPLMVIRKISGKEISGTDYQEGLDLTLEDYIDFTKHENQHPSIEAEMSINYNATPGILVEKPRIVTKDGLKYRETAQRRGSFFSYRIEFKHPGSFYLLELEYPDNEYRTICAGITDKGKYGSGRNQSGVGVQTGGKIYTTGKMQTLSWIHVADRGVHSIEILNGAYKAPLQPTRAAAKSLKIYRIKGDLPVLKKGQSREFGIHTERCTYAAGFGSNFGVGFPKGNQQITEERKLSLMQRFIMDLKFMEATADKYVQYLKFCGQNSHIMGCIQYDDRNTPFITPRQYKTSRILHCNKNISANIFDLNGINFYAGVELTRFRDHYTGNNNAQIAQGKETFEMVDANGKQWMGDRRLAQNWLHPAFRKKYKELLRTLAVSFDDFKSFKGIHFLTSIDPNYGFYAPQFSKIRKSDCPNPFQASYDDYTFSLFEKDTNITLPIEKVDPDRFKKRYILIQHPVYKEKFVKWRCQKLTEFLEEGVKTITAINRSLKFVVPFENSYKRFILNCWLKSKRPLKELLYDFGIDIDMLSKINNLILGRWTIGWVSPLYSGSKDPYNWMPRVDNRILSLFDKENNRYVFVRTSWDEIRYIAPGYTMKDKIRLVESDWIYACNHGRFLPQASGPNAREAFVQALITSAPHIIMFGLTDLNTNVGHEQELRTFAQIYSALPKEKFHPVLNTGLKTNIAIRKLTKGNETYFYLANPGYWFTKGILTLKTEGKIVDLVSNKAILLNKQDNNKILKFALEPYGLIAFKAESPKLEIVSFKTGEISGREKAHMDKVINSVSNLLKNRWIANTLTDEEVKYMRDIVAHAQKALDQKQYALSWSLLTESRFWFLWKERLLKAEKNLKLMSHLPDEIKKKANDNATVKVLKTEQPILVDGKLDEPEWQRDPFVSGFVTRDNTKSFVETGVKAVYDDKAVYLAFICADKNPDEIRAVAKTEKEVFSSKDDVLAVFIQPDENVPTYYQMAFNLLGTQFDQKVDGGDKDYKFHPEWQAMGQKNKEFWTAEVRLPYQAFDLKNKGNSNWRFNVFRIFRNNEVEPSNFSYNAGKVHDIDKFGKLEFGK